MRSRDGVGYVAVALVVAPVVAGGLYSAAASFGLAGAGATGFSVARISAVLTDPSTWRSVMWTLCIAGTATIIATVAAMLVGVRVQGSRVGQWLATASLAVPHIAASLAALTLLGQSGLLSRLAFAAGLTSQPADFPAMVYDRRGVALIVAFAWKEFPFLVLTAVAVLATRNAHLTEVAHTHGADARAVMRRITIPLLWRGIAPAVIAAFAYLIGQYEMAVVLAPSDPLPLSVLTYERAVDSNLAHRGEAHVLGFLALLLTGALVLWHERSRRVAERTLL